MKRSYLWLLVSPMLLAVACAQGEDPNVKGSGGAGGGTILARPSQTRHGGATLRHPS